MIILHGLFLKSAQKILEWHPYSKSCANDVVSLHKRKVIEIELLFGSQFIGREFLDQFSHVPVAFWTLNMDRVLNFFSVTGQLFHLVGIHEVFFIESHLEESSEGHLDEEGHGWVCGEMKAFLVLVIFTVMDVSHKSDCSHPRVEGVGPLSYNLVEAFDRVVSYDTFGLNI